MSRKQKLGIAAGAICLLLCTFSAFAYADPQLPLADCTTKLNEQPTNRNPAYTDQVVEEPPIRIDLNTHAKNAVICIIKMKLWNRKRENTIACSYMGGENG